MILGGIARQIRNSANKMSSFQSPPELMLRRALRADHVQTANMAASASTHRSAVVTELGKPLAIKHLPRKALEDGHARISIKYAAVNFADILTAQGKYQASYPLPFCLGSEFSAEVTEVAPDVDNVKVGDLVFGNSGVGAFSEEAVVPAIVLGTLPKAFPPKIGASFVVSYSTAYMSFTRGVKLKQGDVVLVTAAAGATGLAAVDLAANVFGCEVVAACGSDEKCAVAKAKGAAHTINYNKESLKDRMKEITGGNGANAIFECVGGKLFRECLSSIAFEGTILPIGFTSGEIPSIPANLVLVKNINVTGVFWGSHSVRDPEGFAESVRSVCKLVLENNIKPEVSRIFPLSEVNEAMKFIMDRKSTGKVLLDVQS